MFNALKQLGLKVSPSVMIRFFARRYLSGFGLESALTLARELYAEQGVLSTIDLLGEAASDGSMVATATSTYLKVAEQLAVDETYPDALARPSISLKPSAFAVSNEDSTGSIALDQIALTNTIDQIARSAAAQGVRLTVDMEDHRWTSTTLELFKVLLDRGAKNVGTVLQSRLFRTPEDIEALPDGARIRMVIGVYLEPAGIALTDKRKMKHELLEQCARLFEKGCFVELATHDEEVLERFFKDIVLPRQIPADRYEVQMLLGVPRENVINQLKQGTFCDVGEPVTVRLYLPFALSAADGTAYCRRRLIENPDLVTYGLVNLLKR